MIRLRDISLVFGERALFKSLDWMIPDGTKVGLVGDNGSGKTTLLRIMAGEMEPDGGRVEFQGGGEIGYLPQDLVELGERTVIHYLRSRSGIELLAERLARAERDVSAAAPGSGELSHALEAYDAASHEFDFRGGYSFDAAANRVLRGLGFTPGDAERDCREFSGGVRMRVALAAVLLARPSVLLLDEPTNHLDSESMEWLEGWLREYRGIVVFVSHDRRFLGKMATQIAELSRGELAVYPMSYEEYLVEREAVRLRREREIESQRERVEKITRFVERFRYKASKAAQVQSRIKQLEKMEVGELDASSKRVRFQFPEAARSGREVLRARGLAKSYGGHDVFSALDLEIDRGERVALVGVNGAGKSTLLRILSDTEMPDAGSVLLGHNVKRSYFSQESAQNLDYSHTVWEEALRTGSALPASRKRDLLGAFLFSGDDVNKPIRVLSGGEKSRVALFKLLLSDSNLLILDEPTNHLDLGTRDVFQRALLQYGGTLLIVSHDRWFLDQLATRVVEISSGKLYNYPGNYSHFIEKRAGRLIEEEQGKSGQKPNGAFAGKEDRRAAAEERNRVFRERRAVRERLDPVEEKIAAMEARRSEIDRLLCQEDVLADSSLISGLMVERAALEESLASDYKRWEELAAMLESIG